MRIVRILLASILVLTIIAGTVVGIVFHNEASLVQIVLTRIDASTGFNIVPAGVRVRFRSHLEVTLEQPLVYQRGSEIARLDSIRVVVSYHLMLTSNGLPLRELRLDGLVGRVPAGAAVAAGFAIPRPGIEGMQTVLRMLDAVGSFSSGIGLYDAKLTDPSGQTVIEHFDLVAAREHRRATNSPWLVRYDGEWRYLPLGAFHLSGTAHLETAKQAITGVLWSGDLWFWGLNLNNFAVMQGIAATGAMQGHSRVVLNHDGTVEGHAQADITDGTLNGTALTRPLTLGGFSLTANYQVSERLFRLYKVQITQAQQLVVAGSCTITNPYDPARRADLQVSGIRVSLTKLASYFQVIRAMPATLIADAQKINSGSLAIEQILFGPPVAIMDWSVATIRDNLKLAAIISDAGFDLSDPRRPNLPPVRHLEASVTYNGGMLQVAQGSAALGMSSLSGINGQVRITRAPRSLPYSLRFKSVLDIKELYIFAGPMLKQLDPGISSRIENMQGSAALRVQASGSLKDLTWSEPHDYQAVLAPNRIQLGIRDLRQHLVLVSGQITVTPGQMQIDQLLMAPSDRDSGDVVVNGTALTGSNRPIVRDLTVELHRLRADEWVPLIVPSDDLAVEGELGGKLTANSDLSSNGPPVVTGVVTLSNGKVEPGFMRSPMVVSNGSLSLDGKGLVFDLPDATLEGHPINFKLTLADFAQPALRIDAMASKFNFEVLRFIRLPWSPKTPVHFFPLPVSGHIEAKQANFDKLQMTTVSTDFSRAHDHWLVSNFRADTLGGKVTLDLSGRSANEWIHAHGAVDGIDTASIFTLNGTSPPPLSGRLHADFDFWGNTDTNFFQTLDGTLSFQVSHGLVRRLALLTRVLSLINLKNWLTAHLPDPRIAGVPFDTINALFKGHDGNMYTNDFRLDGPLMVITSRGSLSLGDRTMNMEISLIPFITYNWLLTKIPLVGTHIAGGTNDLVAAYFHVYGPIGNPKVLPKPITSVAEFVAKTLSIPINIIRPNTINP
jgi:hypothetical protein